MLLGVLKARCTWISILPTGLLLVESVGKTYQSIPSFLNPGTNLFPLMVPGSYCTKLGRRHFLIRILARRSWVSCPRRSWAEAATRASSSTVTTPRLLSSELSKKESHYWFWLKKQNYFFLVVIMFSDPLLWALEARSPTVIYSWGKFSQEHLETDFVSLKCPRL